MRNWWGRDGVHGRPGPRRGRSDGSGDREGNAGTNGVHPEGLHTKPILFDEVSNEPADLMAVQADDELIDAIAAGRPLPGTASGSRSDDRITAMLQAWRDDVIEEPMRPLITGGEADAALRAGRRLNSTGPRHSASSGTARARYLVPLASAAAALVVTLSGVAFGAHGAEPGDALWGVSKVLYTERAASMEKKVEVESRLQRVKSALTEGRTEDARRELSAANTDLTDVRPQEGKEKLAERRSFLSEKLDKTPPGHAVDPKELDPPPGPDPKPSTSPSVHPSTSVSPVPPSTTRSKTSTTATTTPASDGTTTSGGSSGGGPSS